MKKICFVVSPIGSDDSPQRKNSDKLLEHILEPVCTEKGYDLIRADKIHNIDKIDQTIIDYLKTAELVIADLTFHNPNVFYEIGYRIALGKPAIQLIQKDYDIPFDVSNVRTIYYDFDIEYVKQVLQQLSQTIEVVEASYSKTDENPDLIQKQNSDMIAQILANTLDIKQDILQLKLKEQESETSYPSGFKPHTHPFHPFKSSHHFTYDNNGSTNENAPEDAD